MCELAPPNWDDTPSINQEQRSSQRNNGRSEFLLSVVLIRVAIAVITYKGQKVVVKVIPKAKKELITLGLLEWNKSRVTDEIPKYGKKVPKNTISAVAGFTAVYWS
ncbi:hypothetical protein KY290_027577 [Solanum tuberosum]|uniref:Uncharacterized protein n=1 Tax=Solanum tuberosum TaxID=4113 RepID=A0ABQ7UIQ6_SOLTU|nr:hypothetical protein KY285_026521 [Solanum tuberosum]KAH0748345.1 hypothetical protein KY290_027577 [Solanum tuberosum]